MKCIDGELLWEMGLLPGGKGHMSKASGLNPSPENWLQVTVPIFWMELKSAGQCGDLLLLHVHFSKQLVRRLQVCGVGISKPLNCLQDGET